MLIGCCFKCQRRQQVTRAILLDNKSEIVSLYTQPYGCEKYTLEKCFVVVVLDVAFKAEDIS